MTRSLGSSTRASHAPSRGSLQPPPATAPPPPPPPLSYSPSTAAARRRRGTTKQLRPGATLEALLPYCVQPLYSCTAAVGGWNCGSGGGAVAVGAALSTSWLAEVCRGCRRRSAAMATAPVSRSYPRLHAPRGTAAARDPTVIAAQPMPYEYATTSPRCSSQYSSSAPGSPPPPPRSPAGTALLDRTAAHAIAISSTSVSRRRANGGLALVGDGGLLRLTVLAAPPSVLLLDRTVSGVRRYGSSGGGHTGSGGEVYRSSANHGTPGCGSRALGSSATAVVVTVVMVVVGLALPPVVVLKGPRAASLAGLWVGERGLMEVGRLGRGVAPPRVPGLVSGEVPSLATLWGEAGCGRVCWCWCL